MKNDIGIDQIIRYTVRLEIKKKYCSPVVFRRAERVVLSKPCRLICVYFRKRFHIISKAGRAKEQCLLGRIKFKDDVVEKKKINHMVV